MFISVDKKSQSKTLFNSERVTVLVTVFISVFVKGQNPNVYKWPEAESNCRPLVFQTSALPTELSGLMAGTTGFEPATSCVTGRRELQTSPRPQL